MSHSPPGKAASLWLETTARTDYPALREGLKVDVAIIGGGIAGITTAWMLKRAGMKVAILESLKIVEGVTGFTTAKVSSQHHLIYADLIKKFGEDGARTYAQSNEAALAAMRDLVVSEGIDCDWEEQSAYTYALAPDDVDQLREEEQAALTLGLPASFTTETSLPYDIAGALRFNRQAQFHPRKYLLHLAQGIPGDGSFIFEDTRVTGLDQGDECVVETERGNVTAENVVVATNMPIFDRGFFFAKVHPERSYVVTADWDGAEAFKGMYISVGGSTRSIRTMIYEGRHVLQVGGEGHKTGQELDTEERYNNLETWAREQFGVSNFLHHWSTQDCVSIDRVPYIGRLTRGMDNVSVATGFGKWGMTGGTVAATILSDSILGRDNPWASLYDAKRLNPVASVKDFTQENLNVAQHFVGDRLSHPQQADADELAPGQGGIVKVDGRKSAAFRDDAGKLHAFSHVCTHLGCHVRWNEAEVSFDCPCHGSRFDRFGKVIQGPAVKDLEPREQQNR